MFDCNQYCRFTLYTELPNTFISECSDKSLIHCKLYSKHTNGNDTLEYSDYFLVVSSHKNTLVYIWSHRLFSFVFKVRMFVKILCTVASNARVVLFSCRLALAAGLKNSMQSHCILICGRCFLVWCDLIVIFCELIKLDWYKRKTKVVVFCFNTENK